MNVPRVLTACGALVAVEELEDDLARHLGPHALVREGLVEGAVLLEAGADLARVVGAHEVHRGRFLARGPILPDLACPVRVQGVHCVEEEAEAAHCEGEVDEHVGEGDTLHSRLNDAHRVRLRAIHDLHERGEAVREGPRDVRVVEGLSGQHLARGRLDDVLVPHEGNLVEGARADAALDGAHLVRRVPADVLGQRARARVERHRVDVEIRGGPAKVDFVIVDAVLGKGLEHAQAG
mmetsp:Transcript_27759/g.74719  ORF Transcript_27759/g.74719 Transcript_27759/m.74719 type:complete len:236 (-) Transcript_27759:1364-2071(-)